jgi:hypothetical protein
MYSHEVLMSLQTRAKYLGIHCSTSVTVSVIRDFNMTCYLVVVDFLFELVYNDDRVNVKSYVLLMSHKAVGLLLKRLTMYSGKWIVAVFY